MKVGVFHPGTQHSWQTALAFQEAGLLAWHATSVFYDPARWPYKLERYVPEKTAARLHGEFLRRKYPHLKAENVRQFGLWEWSEILLRRAGRHALADRCNEHGNKAFCKQVIRLIEREPVDLLWGFNTSSLEVFQWAKKRGIRRVLDQTIGHPAAQNRVMLEEQERHPEFFMDSYEPYPQDWIDRQNEEVAEADLVVTGSEFCARTMVENDCAPEKVLVLNYGYDESLFPAQRPNRSGLCKRPMRCLFAGQVGPRKGAPYLLQALENVPAGKVECTMVGRLAIPSGTFERYLNRVRYVPQVPRSEMVRFFAEADCFVFPSLFEGSAIVLYEACGAGLGIIQSDRCGDGVSKGQNGCVLPEISTQALTQAIQLIAEDPTLCERWQAASWTLRKNRTWAGYRHRVTQQALAL